MDTAANGNGEAVMVVEPAAVPPPVASAKPTKLAAVSGLAMAALLKFAPIGQILFGSDHPYVSDADNLTDLKSCGLSQAQMNAILYENAERLVPRLKG